MAALRLSALFLRYIKISKKAQAAGWLVQLGVGRNRKYEMATRRDDGIGIMK